MSKINKALDLNKLFETQKKGKLLKKNVLFPMFASIKYDGNYVVVEVVGGRTRFVTSGGLTYTHLDEAGKPFENCRDGAYLCERISCMGALGDRDRCNLRGSKDAQTSEGHNYKCFDYLTIEEYIAGKSEASFLHRKILLENSGLESSYIATQEIVKNQKDLDELLKEYVNMGYEGLMCISPAMEWKDTKSRTVDLIKYKKRRTADLLCTGTGEGEGKYEGLIGSLQLEDRSGRVVMVGSGLSDEDRHGLHAYFIGSVVEIEFERIADTYIQPTFIRVRDDKHETEID